MEDVSWQTRLARIASTLGGLLALGLLVVVLVVMGKPIVAQRTASGATPRSTQPPEQATHPSLRRPRPGR